MFAKSSAGLASEEKKVAHGARRLDLDVVRGVAILLAMGWHLNGPRTDIPVIAFLLWPGRNLGWAGVDLFFVLSGFLVGRLIFNEIDRTGKFDALRFLSRRALKLWPILYVFLLCMLVMFPWRDFLFQIGLHVQNYLTTPVATHLWSLAVEEHFYLIFSLIFYWIGSRSNVQKLASLVIWILPLALFLRLGAALIGIDFHAIQIQSQFRMDSLAAGVYLAGMFNYHRRLFDMLCRFKTILLFICGSLTLIVASIDKYSFVGAVFGYTLTIFWAVSMIFLIYNLNFPKNLKFAFSAVGFLGIYSYAIYIWHVPAFRITEIAFRKINFSGPGEITIISSYVVSILAGVVATKIIERPVLRFREIFLPSRVNGI